jgi:hypothetical protein
MDGWYCGSLKGRLFVREWKGGSSRSATEVSLGMVFLLKMIHHLKVVAMVGVDHRCACRQ